MSRVRGALPQVPALRICHAARQCALSPLSRAGETPAHVALSGAGDRLFTARPRVLHVAPERCFIKRFERALGDRYVTADLESPLAKVKMDIQRIPFPDDSFDVIFCNHILEHVEDDRLALREMFRVMRPGGWGILLSPVNYEREVTYEDPSITDEAGRERAFGQKDHVRDYGRDYPDRLAEAGFSVESIDYAATLAPEEVARYALRHEIVYLVRK